MIRRLSTQSASFDAELKALLALEAEQDAGIERTVVEILAQIRQRGDAALLEFTRKFDHLDVHDAHHLELPQSELQAALASLSHEQRAALETAAARIRAFHERQRMDGWTFAEDSDARCPLGSSAFAAVNGELLNTPPEPSLPAELAELKRFCPSALL